MYVVSTFKREIVYHYLLYVFSYIGHKAKLDTINTETIQSATEKREVTITVRTCEEWKEVIYHSLKVSVYHSYHNNTESDPVRTRLGYHKSYFCF